MKEIFEEAYKKYTNHMLEIIPDYWNPNNTGFQRRRSQCVSFLDALNDKFNYDNIQVLETGVSHNYYDGIFGLFLGYAAEKTNAKLISIDINCELVNKSKLLFDNIIPNLDYRVYCDDSVNFLNNLKEDIPNLVHLDSYDLDLKNPFPSALHGWNEFIAIESKMVSGSIIIIDDNFIGGTWVDWNYADGTTERIVINYPMVGKGTHVYNYVLSGKSDWNLIGDHYNQHTNIKIIIQKK